MRFFEKVRLFCLAGSFGGVESLCDYPIKATAAKISPEQREALGLNEKLIRLSVGVEDTLDLIADLDQALDYDSF